MRTVSVCVGSSCHLRGAYDVIRELQRLMVENRLQAQLDLRACFCTGRCQDGVCIRIDDEYAVSLTKEQVAPFFKEHFPAEF